MTRRVLLKFVALSRYRCCLLPAGDQLLQKIPSSHWLVQRHVTSYWLTSKSTFFNRLLKYEPVLLIKQYFFIFYYKFIQVLLRVYYNSVKLVMSSRCRKSFPQIIEVMILNTYNAICNPLKPIRFILYQIFIASLQSLGFLRQSEYTTLF